MTDWLALAIGFGLGANLFMFLVCLIDNVPSGALVASIGLIVSALALIARLIP